MFSGLPSGRPCAVRLSTSIPRDAIFIHVVSESAQGGSGVYSANGQLSTLRLPSKLPGEFHA